jgi:hypothetical protein
MQKLIRPQKLETGEMYTIFIYNMYLRGKCICHRRKLFQFLCPFYGVVRETKLLTENIYIYEKAGKI